MTTEVTLQENAVAVVEGVDQEATTIQKDGRLLGTTAVAYFDYVLGTVDKIALSHAGGGTVQKEGGDTGTGTSGATLLNVSKELEIPMNPM